MVGAVLIWAYEAFALKVLWGWFVVPLGLNPLTMPIAFGLTLLPLLFKRLDSIKIKVDEDSEDDQVEDEINKIKLIFESFVKVTLLLVFGLFFSLFL